MKPPTKIESATSAKSNELALAAFRLFSTRGIVGVSMDDIASAVGVTKGSLYWHYSSKKEVILAACGHYYANWRAEMAESMDAVDSAFGKLEAAVAFSVRSCLLDDENRIFTTEIVALSFHDAEVRASWAGFLDETERLFLELTGKAVEAGDFVCDDVDRAAKLMIAAMEGVKQVALFRPATPASGSAERTTGDLMAVLGAPVRDVRHGI